jgi:hypothetical protein
MTPPPSPVLLVFPVDGEEKDWPLTQDEVDRLQGLYGSLDVFAECKKAFAWITASHTNRKTFGGMLKFLTNWLNKATTLPKPTKAPTFFDRAPEIKLKPLASEMMSASMAAEIYGGIPPAPRLEVRHG